MLFSESGLSDPTAAIAFPQSESWLDAPINASLLPSTATTYPAMALIDSATVVLTPLTSSPTFFEGWELEVDPGTWDDQLDPGQDLLTGLHEQEAFIVPPGWDTNDNIFAPPALAKTAKSRLVVIDATIADADILAASVTDADVVILDPHTDGIEQITALLANYQNLDSLHIVSHGDTAQFTVGTTTLAPETLSQYTQQLAQWQSAFSETADILLYGCNVAAGGAGQTLIQELGQLTGADVAASDDLTGNAGLGGDWQLEAQTGAIEADLAFSAEIQNRYQAVYDLNLLQVTAETPSGDVTGGYALDIYDPNQDNDVTVTLEDNGDTLKLEGNGWRKIALPYTITADTVLEFDFKSTEEGEIHAIGFDVDDVVSGQFH